MASDEGGRPPGGGRAQADRELRRAVLVAVPVLLAGQLLLVVGWWPVAVVIGLAGTAAALVLARRWARMSAD